MPVVGSRLMFIRRHGKQQRDKLKSRVVQMVLPEMMTMRCQRFGSEARKTTPHSPRGPSGNLESENPSWD